MGDRKREMTLEALFSSLVSVLAIQGGSVLGLSVALPVVLVLFCVDRAVQVYVDARKVRW